MVKKNISRQYLINFIDKNKKLLKNEFNVERIGVFGSYARNDYTPESDVDLIVEFNNNTKNIYEAKTLLKQFFENELHKNIDVTRKKYLKSTVRDQILKETIYV